MMHSVLPTPVCKRRQSHQTAQSSHHSIRAARLEERIVAAVMLNDKGANQQAGGWERQNENKPI
jgi:hypothetical protein